MSMIPSTLPPGVMRADEGEQHTVFGHSIAIKSPGEETGGAVFIWEIQSPAGTMVPPHIHAVEDEYIYLVEGQLEVTVGDQSYVVSPGDLVKMPKHVPHGVRVPDNSPAKTLWLVTPAGKMESLFRVLSELPVDQPPDPARIVEIFAAHDIEALPPPGM